MPMLPPLRDWPRQGLLALVRGYRFFLSPWLGSSCRFEPTCSAFALQALERHLERKMKSAEMLARF